MSCFSVLITLRSCLIFSALLSFTHVSGQTRVPSDSTAVTKNDSTVNKGDSSRNALIERLKAESDLDAPINYQAKSHMVLDMDSTTLFLSKGGKLKYEDLELEADSVAVNWSVNTLYAQGKKDSSGQISGQPVFKEGDNTYNTREVRYNFKTQKGIVKAARYKEGEDYILAQDVRKENDSVYYIKNGKFTTCDLPNPHFYIRSKKLKIIPRDKIITGPLSLVIADFPIPIVVPFGFFPNQSGKRSGIVLPTYGEADDRGFFLRNLGYYWAINDYFDLLVRGDIFTKGGYRIETSTSYTKRYRFDGTLGFEYGYQKFGQDLDPSKREERNFFIRWRHNQKIDPTTTLTGSVNAGSSNYLNANSYDTREFLTNTLQSNVSFRKSFASGAWTLTTNLDHNQNTQTKNVSLGLPNLSVTRTRFFPFKSKNRIGKEKFWETIGMNYTANLQNRISGADSNMLQILLRPRDQVELVTLSGVDTIPNDTVYRQGSEFYRNGLVHRIPINTSFSLFQYINITPNLNYNEYWYLRTTDKVYNSETEEVEDVSVNGFAAARDFNVNVNASTRIYGIFNFKGKRQPAIRHTLLPNVGYSYKPDFSDSFWGYFRSVQTDADSTEFLRYSIFEDGLFGGPSAGESQSINFGINNQLEMKIRKKDIPEDTTNLKKQDMFNYFPLLDALSLNSSYNFAADSLNLANFSLSARTNILKGKLSILVTGNLDPYVFDTTVNQRVNRFKLAEEGKLARMNNLSIALTTSLKSKRRTGGNSGTPTRRRIPADERAHIQYYRDLYIDFTVPWTLNLNSNISFINTGAFRDTTFTMNFSGDLNLTPKWKIGFTSGYDFLNKDFSYTSLSIYRDLHCWEMSLTWIPFGIRKSYNFSINVKSATLKDLKLTRRRDWQDRF